MIMPNLASRPFLNNRPVWILTSAAVLATVMLTVLNIQLYLDSDQRLAEHLALRDQLLVEHKSLNQEIRSHSEKLDRVPWRSLSNRVSGVNNILNEQAFSWLIMLNHLEEVLPYNVRLISISPDVDEGEVHLRLRAVAQTREALLVFLEQLIADPVFINPMPIIEERPESAQAVGYLFTLEVDYLTDGEVE